MMETLRLYALAGIISLLPVSLSAKEASEFGDSITWDASGEAPSLRAMRGKSVLVFFYQDWCSKCNGWSGNLFNQVNENFKNDPHTVLVALKTDGGTMKQARAYLKQRMDTSNWLIGLDDGGAYYRQAAGNTDLYQYMHVNPDGTIEKIAKSSLGYNRPNGREFVLAMEETRKMLQKGTTVLFENPSQMPEALQPAIDKAEQGLFLTALKLAAKSGLKDDELKIFHTTISARISQMIDADGEVLSDHSSKKRYLAYLALEKWAVAFRGSPQGEAAQALISVESGQQWVRDEEEAGKDFKKIQSRASRADDDRARDRIKRSFAKLAEKFPDTYYGILAAAEAE